MPFHICSPCPYLSLSCGEPSLLVSPLVVAGIVIGLVLFLSCVTIIVGSLRKDSRLRNPHLRASYGQCRSQYSPYEECVGPGATEIYIPTDDPPPYSLLDPYQEATGRGGEEPNHHHTHTSTSSSSSTDSPASTSWFSPGPPLHHHHLLHHHHCFSGQHIASISYPMEEAPPYESVLMDSGQQPLPLVPCDLYKHQTEAGGEGGGSRLAEASQIR
uniref:Brain expressed, associated with NEDD4, 1 n=1 Tax=Neogobius melanostomus TaxID=47308 RepID=A0A8C6S3Z3_9GOBI